MGVDDDLKEIIDDSQGLIGDCKEVIDY